MNFCRLLQSRWGRKTRWQTNVHQRQQARSGCHVLLVWRGEWGGAEIKPHTYREGTFHVYPHTRYHARFAGTTVEPAWVTATRWQSEDSDRSITEMWTMGLKTDRSIVLQEKGRRKTELDVCFRKIEDTVEPTHSHTHLAMFPAAATMEFCVMVATRLIPWPSAPRSYT